MSWPTESLVCVREEFALAALARREPFVRLCSRYRIGRSTGYKWLQRFICQGRAGLADISRRPHHCPGRLKGIWQLALRQLRRRHPYWGARKLRARLRQLHPRVHLPSVRTLARWLQRLGFIRRRRRHQRRGPQLPPLKRTVPRSVNQVWTMDFKGWFRTTDGSRVDPLTVRDLKSRFLLDIRLLPNQTYQTTQAAVLRLFRRYGLPKVIRVDNGPPFGGGGPLGLSRLSVWWRCLNIRVEFGRPAHPQDNAAHEQMHAVYQREVAARPQKNRFSQQRASDRWRTTYNQQRPHEALGFRTPAQLYRASNRRLPRKLPPWTYPAGWHVHRLTTAGRFFWQDRQRCIGEAFGGQSIGLRPLSAKTWDVFLGPDLLGQLHSTDYSSSLRQAQRRH